MNLKSSTAHPLLALLLIAAATIFPTLCSAQNDDTRTGDPMREQYEAAYERLKDTYTLERVAAEGIEVTYDDLSGMATLLSSCVPIQAPLHYNPLFVQPDLSIALGKETDSLYLGFALGEHAEIPDFYKTTRTLHKGYQPIVTSTWNAGAITVEQTAFSYLPDESTVTRGNETQYVLLRFRVSNNSTVTFVAPLFLMVGHPGPIIKIGPLGTGGRREGGPSHWPFKADHTRWQVDPMRLKLDGNALLLQNEDFHYRTVLTYSSDDSVTTTLHKKIDFGEENALHPGALNNVLQFNLSIAPGDTQTIDIVAAGTTNLYPDTERLKMASVDFDEALNKTSLRLDRILHTGAKFSVPEEHLNNMFKALILSAFTSISRNPDHDWLEAYQSPFLWESLQWEQAFMLIPLMSLGYAEEVEPCIRFYIDRQMGVGPFAASAAEGYGPPAATSFAGSYPGYHSIDWMPFTGCTLWMMAEYYNYTKDADYLKSHRESIEAAWAWAQKEREHGRKLDENGERVRHYGLITPGRAGDIAEGNYIYTFNDNYTWIGMAKIAAAFSDARLPGAGKMQSEADEYRQCILDVMRREEHTEPKTGLPFVPSMAYWKPGETHDVYWHAHGPMQLFATGILEPDDKRFAPMIEYLGQTTGILLGFAEYFGQPFPHWYMGQVERTYYQCYLERGEFEKAILTFYSCMNYAVSKDCFQTAERNNMFESNFRPYMNNGSGTGRLLDMLRRIVIDEQDADKGILWLLRGAPRPWFAEGETIRIEDVPTLFGEMSLATESSGGKVRVTLETPRREPPNEVRIIVRHPSHKAIAQATANGRNLRVDGNTIFLPKPRGNTVIECVFQQS